MMNSFSPNMLKTFEACPKKYYFKYIQKISVPQKSAVFETGKKVHALANYYLRGDDITKMEKALNSDEKLIWEQLKNNEFFKKSYINSEYNLSCKIGDYWIGGRLDALMKSRTTGLSEGKKTGNLTEQKSSTIQPFNHSTNYYILDYKTGSIPKNPEYDYQTMVYLLCASKLLEKQTLKQVQSDVRNIKFVYIDLKNNQNCIIDFTPEKEKEYEKNILAICDKITNAQLPEEIEHSKMCEFCEYRKICL